MSRAGGEGQGPGIKPPPHKGATAGERKAVEWDEYGQGYNAQGKLVVCICGKDVEPGGVGHYCPYDRPEPDSGEGHKQEHS